MQNRIENNRIVELNGLFIGQLTDEELIILDQAVKDGLAERDYSTPAGFFLGLGKVRVLA
jgi:hypothetical protein